MGMYTSLRFKTRLEPRFVPVIRELLSCWTLTGITNQWEYVAGRFPHFAMLIAYANIDRATNIPFMDLQYAPREWGEHCNTLEEDIWTVACSSKNPQTIRYFLDYMLQPMTLELFYCEYKYEEDEEASVVEIHSPMRSLAIELQRVQSGIDDIGPYDPEAAYRAVLHYANHFIDKVNSEPRSAGRRDPTGRNLWGTLALIAQDNAQNATKTYRDFETVTGCVRYCYRFFDGIPPILRRLMRDTFARKARGESVEDIGGFGPTLNDSKPRGT